MIEGEETPGQRVLSEAEIEAQLKELYFKQSHVTKLGDWTREDTAELDGLERKLEAIQAAKVKPFDPKLGQRQTRAGTVVDAVRQPELTPQERQTIVNTAKSPGTQSQRGK